MKKNFLSPSEVAEAIIKSGEYKANLNIGKMILLGIMAGAFIAFGGAASNVSMHGIADIGIAKTVAGVVFPVGLMLVVFTASELFTGNCLMIMAFLDKKIKGIKVLKNLVVVYFSNLLGALILDTLIYFSGQLDMTGGTLGAYAIKIAVAKTTINPATAIVSGILCNILVCLAIVLATSATDVIGKIFGIFFPIMAFVICCFEHCVANMFYLPIGIMSANNPIYVEKAQELYGLTAQQISAVASFNGVESLLFVTVGNVIGGFVLGIAFYYGTKTKKKATDW